MSLYVNDERRDNYLPASITVYGDVKPKTEPIDCRTCKHGLMATCELGGCTRGAEYERAAPLRFWVAERRATMNTTKTADSQAVAGQVERGVMPL